MKKENTRLEICLITLFIGLLLTFSIVYTVNATVDTGKKTAVGYDGTVLTGEGFFADFTRAVYQDAATLSRVNEYRYRLFGIVDHPNIFGGKENFLFEIENEKNGYNYLEDYTGNAAFSEAEMRRILLALREKQGSYAQRGAQYLLVVLPNTQSVYDEYMPDYLGAISKSTRLAVLEEFLLQNRFAHILDPTEELDGYRREGLLYNNTENTLNSRGMYFIYRTICDHISPTVMQNTNTLTADQLSFYQHTTRGKAIAQKAALADVAQNHTVSLSNTAPIHYRLIYDAGQISTSVLHTYGQPSGTGSSLSLLLQFGDDWERSQAEPFFSGTFGRVTYQIGYEDSAEIFAHADPDIVIQFVREDELSLLLQH